MGEAPNTVEEGKLQRAQRMLGTNSNTYLAGTLVNPGNENPKSRGHGYVIHIKDTKSGVNHSPSLPPHPLNQ